MKLDAGILDHLIEEELQRMLTEIRDEDLEFARQQSALAQAQIADVYGQKAIDAASETTATKPETTATSGAGKEMAAARKSRQPKKKSWWKRFTTAPEISAEDAAKKKSASQQYYDMIDDREAKTGLPQDVNRKLYRLAQASPILGGLTTTADVWTDPKLSTRDKMVRTYIAGAQELDPAKQFRGLKTMADIATGVPTAVTGTDPADAAYAFGAEQLPGAWKDPEKHAKQQAQAKAAADPTARSAARDGLTASELDTRNQQRLALRKKGLQPYEIEHLEKYGTERVDRFLASGANAVNIAGDLRKAETPASRAAAREARKSAGARQDQRQRLAALGSPDPRADATIAAHKLAGTGPYAASRASGRKKSRQRQVAVREGVKSTMLNENQIKRFQRLANCAPPQKRLITEAMDPLSIIGTILVVAAMAELGGAKGAAFRHKFMGTTPEDDPYMPAAQALIQGTESLIQSVWKKLTGIAKTKTEEGDSGLESLLQTIASSGAEGAARLSFSQLAKIKEKFADDEELAALLSQLVTTRTGSTEQYGEVLSQVEQHIRSRL